MSENTTSFVEGQKVRFIGFADPEDTPDNGELLEDGAEYAVVGFGDTEDEDGNEVEQSILIAVPNPDFDSSKRRTKNNPEYLSVDVFAEEIEEVEAASEEEAEEEAPAPKRTAAKKTAKKTAKKAPAKKKTVAKKKAADDEAPAFPVDLPEDMILLTADEQDEEIMGEIEEHEDICEYAEELAQEGNSVAYRLGGVLYNVRLTGAFKQLDERYAGKGGFALFVNERMSVSYRHAMYLIDIYAKFRHYGISSDVVKQIGWTKAAAIVPVLNEGNADELVELATSVDDDGKSITVNDLKASITANYEQDGKKRKKGKVKKLIRFNFKLFEDSAASVREIFEQAKESLGGEMDDSQVFEHIMTEWATEHLDVSARSKRTATKRAATKAPVKKATAKAPAKKAPAKTAAPRAKKTARARATA